MRRKVIGYDKTIELMKKGIALRESPVGYSLYMYVDDEIVSVRTDVLTKLLRNKVEIRKQYDGWTSLIYLKESE